MRKAIAVVILITIVVGAWCYASPIWTLRAMRDAAKDRDQAKLSAYVDYPALRADVKHDIGDYASAKAGKRFGEPGRALAAYIANALGDPAVDAVVSPAGVEAMFASGQQLDAAGTRIRVPVKAGDHPVIERDGFSSFRVRGEDAGKGALVFHREGFGWKLVGVDLPAPEAPVV
jgi:hypothetical protein